MSTAIESFPHVMYSANGFLKSGSPSTAEYPTSAEELTELRYALISRAAAFTKATSQFSQVPQ